MHIDALKGHTYCTICDVISFSVRRCFWQLSAREEGNLAKHAQMRPIGWIGLEFHANNLNFTLQNQRKISPSHRRLLDDQNFHIPRRLGENFASSKKTMKRSTNWPKKTDKKETKRMGLRMKKKKSRQVVFFSFKNYVKISISAHAQTQILKYFYKWQ